MRHSHPYVQCGVNTCGNIVGVAGSQSSGAIGVAFTKQQAFQCDNWGVAHK